MGNSLYFKKSSLKIYNSLSKKKEELEIQNSRELKMFTCGPSIYKKPHIGNYRTFLFEDILHRYLEYLGYKVLRTINFTDIEDKAIEEAKEKGKTVNEITKGIAKIFFDEIILLNIKPPTYFLRSSETVEESINIIKRLLEKGHAYYYKKDIYFDPLTFKGFGKLYGLDMKKWPKKKFRFKKDNYPYNKWNMGDFILWHSCEDESYPCWDSEMGRGWPAWNVQDPAIILKSLGKKVDICCGGIDNLTMHHDYNIAIMETYTEEDFCPYWLHGHHLFVDGKKMSKRKDNIIYVDTLIKKGYSPSQIRFFLIYSRYREKMNFTFKKLDRTSDKLDNIKKMSKYLMEKINNTVSSNETKELIPNLLGSFENNMDNNLDVKEAFDQVYDIIKNLYYLKKKGKVSDKDSTEIYNNLKKIDEVLKIIFN